MLSVLEIILEEVKERDVVGGHCHHDFVLLLETLEALDSLLDLLVLDEVNGLGNFHFRLNLRKVGGFQSLDDVVVSSEDVLLDERSNKLGSFADISEGFLFLLFKVLLQRVKLANFRLLLVLELHKFFLLFFINAWDIDEKETFEPGAHLFLVAKGVKADDQVEADIEIGSVVHDILVHLDCFAEALLLDECEADILLDLQLHLFVLLRG